MLHTILKHCCNWIFKTNVYTMLRDYGTFESIIWPLLSVTGLSNISITCILLQLTSVSGEKTLNFIKDFVSTAL